MSDNDMQEEIEVATIPEVTNLSLLLHVNYNSRAGVMVLKITGRYFDSYM